MTKDVKRSARGSFAIPEETFQKLKLYAARTGKTFNQVLNVALEEFIERNKEIIAFAQRQEQKFRAVQKKSKSATATPEKAEKAEDYNHDGK